MAIIVEVFALGSSLEKNDLVGRRGAGVKVGSVGINTQEVRSGLSL